MIKKKHPKKWTADVIHRYSLFAQARAAIHERAKTEFTCEDFALQVVLEYARIESLPIEIRNGSGSFSMHDFNTHEEFRVKVMMTTGATDLWQDDLHNTVALGTGKTAHFADVLLARAGDLIVVNSGHHIQLVSAVDTEVVWITQGNLNFKCNAFERWLNLHDAQDPSDATCYAGENVKTKGYNKKTGLYGDNGKYRQEIYRTQSGRTRRWNFAHWNNL